MNFENLQKKATKGHLVGWKSSNVLIHIFHCIVRFWTWRGIVFQIWASWIIWLHALSYVNCRLLATQSAKMRITVFQKSDRYWRIFIESIQVVLVLVWSMERHANECGCYRIARKYFWHHHTYQYVSDFDDFSTIRKRRKSAFKWYKNHQNPIGIDIFCDVKSFSAHSVASAFISMVVLWYDLVTLFSNIFLDSLCSIDTTGRRKFVSMLLQQFTIL